MRTMPKNKQNMWYSLQNTKTVTYELDENGDPIQLLDIDGTPMYDEHGNPIYIVSGEVLGYSTPVEFKASISSELNELSARSYGVSQSNVYSQIACNKGEFPFEIGTLVWRETEPQYDDDGNVLPKSADYTIMGIMTENLHSDWYLLQRNTKEADE